MTLPSAQFRGDEFSGPAAVLLQILPRLLLPTGGSSLTVAACVSSLAGTFVVSLASGGAAAGPLSPALGGLTPNTSTSSTPLITPSTFATSTTSKLLPSSAAFLLSPGSGSVPDERVLVAAGAA